MSLERRRAALARCFQLVALAAGVPGAWIACSSNGSTPPQGADASAGPIDAAPMEQDVATPIDAADVRVLDSGDGAACWAVVSLGEGGADAADAGPDAEELCDFFMPCGLGPSGLVVINGCQVVPPQPDGAPPDPDAAIVNWPYCTLMPGEGCADGGYDPPDGGPVKFECIGCFGNGGRRPAGMPRERACVPRGRAAAEYFAQLARMERASVRAFVDLGKELAAHGAPCALVDACRVAAEDEVRHARSMTKLARRFGGGSPARVPYVRRRAPRSLAAIARENAIEGCVRETFGALLNAEQARRAADPEVRAAMRVVAEEELRHAALAWEIATWAEGELAPSARRAVLRARRRAAARLVSSVGDEVRPSFAGAAGLPDPGQARALARGLFERLWA